jgi:4-alpha-glucanotransferase
VEKATHRASVRGPRSGSSRRGVLSRPPRRGSAFALDRRSSGILLHVTSLPGPHGSGDLGREARHFVEFLASAGQTWWQVLPVGPPGRAPGFSPYDSCSAFAGSPWLVSLGDLARDGWLAAEDLAPVRGLNAHAVEFELVQRFREERLRRAFAEFRRRHGDASREFGAFRDASAEWLEDFALFGALRRESGGKPWIEWDSGLQQREASSLRAARERLTDEIEFQRFAQFAFHRQWRALRELGHERGIGFIGDLPIFVAHDSADAWSHPELFHLDRSGRPKRVSGYPPDRFNAHGQWWGHPQYDWPAHESSGFDWWLRRFARMFELFDALRVDHFLGFNRTWSIPAHANDAEQGRWVSSPGFELFAALERKLGRLPLIAEDLGRVTADDVRLRDEFGLAPMRIFQFGFGSEADSSDHLPHNYERRIAAYTGNHDTDATRGWYRELSQAQRERVTSYVGGKPATLERSAVRALMASHADTVVFPMQDVLLLDHRARMNTPGTPAGNWRWRMTATKLEPHARELRELAATFGRSPSEREPARESKPIRSNDAAPELDSDTSAAGHVPTRPKNTTAKDERS